MSEHLEQSRDEEVLVDWFENYYKCPDCGTAWVDEWSCMCNDRCPECNAETEPTSSTDLRRPLTDKDYVNAARLMSRRSRALCLVITKAEAKQYAEAVLEGGGARAD